MSLHPRQLFMVCFQPSLWPEHIRVSSKDIYILEEIPRAVSNVGSSGNVNPTHEVSFCRSSFWHEASDRRKDAHALADDGLQIGQRSCFGIGDGCAERVGGELGNETGVDVRIGENVEEYSAD